MKEIFDWLWILQLQISVMIGAVLMLRLLLLRAPRLYSYILWILVFLRLLCPVTISSPVSIIPSGEQLLSVAENLTGQENGQDMQASVFTENEENPLINPAGTGTKENAEGVENREDSENMPIGERLEITQNKAGVFSHVEKGEWIYGTMFFVWVLGATALIIYNVTALIRLKGRLKAAKLQEGYYVSSFIETPFVLGFFFPRIYLPKGVGAHQLTYILKHEQTHITRRDHIIKPLCLLLTCIYWFNPFLWAAFLLLSKDMEMSCDETVLKSFDQDIKEEYSRSLLEFASGRKCLSVPLAFGENGVKSRIANVLRFKKKGLWISAVAVCLCAAAGIGLLTTRAGRPQEADMEEGTQNEDVGRQEDGVQQEEDSSAVNHEYVKGPEELSAEQILDSFVWQDSLYRFYETGLYKVLPYGGLKCIYPGELHMSRYEHTIAGKYCYFWVDLTPIEPDYWADVLIEVDLETEIWRVAYDSAEEPIHEIGSFRVSEEPYATETKPVTGRIYPLGEAEEMEEEFTAYWDLDLDGEEEEIRFIDMQNFYLLTVNGSSQGFYGSYIPSPPQAISLDGEKYYLIVYDEGPSNDPLTHFFYYQDGRLWEAGEIPDNIAEREINAAGEIPGYYRFDLMQTEWAKVTWVLTDKGVMIKEQEYYEHAGTQGMELLTQLPVHSEMNLDSETTMLSPGPVELLYTDMENWYYIADENGNGGWFHIEERFGKVTELEKECWEVFEGLNYAD